MTDEYAFLVDACVAMRVRATSEEEALEVLDGLQAVQIGEEAGCGVRITEYSVDRVAELFEINGEDV